MHLSLWVYLEQGSRVQHSCFFYMQTCVLLLSINQDWLTVVLSCLRSTDRFRNPGHGCHWKSYKFWCWGQNSLRIGFTSKSSLRTLCHICHMFCLLSSQKCKYERFLCSIPVFGYIVSCPSTQQRCNLSQSPILLVSVPNLSLPMLSSFCFVCRIPYLVAIASPAVGVLRSCRRPNAYCNSIICWGNWSIIQCFTSDLKLNLKTALWPAVNNIGFRKVSFDISRYNGENTLAAGIVENCFLFSLNWQSSELCSEISRVRSW